MTSLTPWRVIAANLPEHANNAIHTDAGARAAGFPGALVAGVTTYAYLTHAPAMAWGQSWLTGGGAQVRFRHPVLDGDTVELQVVGDTTVSAVVDGDTKAEAEFTEQVPALEAKDGEPLQPIEFVVDVSWSDYGVRAGDDCPLYADLDIAHPTSWPRIANQFCHEQLVTGSWIHVRSRIAHHGLAAVGSAVRATAVVVERFDSRAGERAVLHVAVEADGAAVASIEHEAIIRLRS